ncbi:MAG: ABC transporter ATP-binding protein [Lachnospiraceae bacterium]|nr:ABC transporter ATP-binding protein [Lachnospiraceae bacterium]
MEALKMENITKIYPNGFVANKGITFSVQEGEIHALVGENGAGKTTLMKVLFGMEQPQEGRIFVGGKQVKITSPLDAIAKGVGMVHQHFMLVPSMTVAQNVTLGIEPRKHGLVDNEACVKMTQQLSDKSQFGLDATATVSELSVGLMQKVEILKALARGAKVLILDEPTAVLTPQETKELFEQLKLLKKSGHSVIFISHKLEEVMELCDNVTILRHGYCNGSYPISELDERKLSRLMVGRDVILKIEKSDPKPGKPVLEVKNLEKLSDEGKVVLDHISFTIREGEVLGIAGVEGNGQNYLSDCISGMQKYDGGDVLLNGKSISGRKISDIRRSGMSHIPEDRMTVGCVSTMSIMDNVMADRFDRPENMKGIFLDQQKAIAQTDALIKEFEISCDDRSEEIRLLSGGNIQKVVVAREFTSGANFVLANQPTRGVDVGTAEMIRKYLVRQVREKQIASLLISADLNEVLEVSDRLLVIRQGKIVAAFSKASMVSEDELGEYMLGIKTMTPDEMEGLL